MSRTRVEIEAAGRKGAGHYLTTEDGARAYRVLDEYYLAVDEDDKGITPWIKSDGFWEAWITKWFEDELAGRDYVVFDVGANIGYYGFFAAKRGHEVIMLEPNPKLWSLNVQTLRANVFKHEPVSFMVAAGKESGSAVLSVPVESSGAASIAIDHSQEQNVVRHNVEVWALDSFVAAREHHKYRLLKIDVEGAEEAVWEGMQDLLHDDGSYNVVLLEFGWNRYANPYAFASKLFKAGTVGYVDTQGEEQRLSYPEELEHMNKDFEMLVIRVDNRGLE